MAEGYIKITDYSEDKLIEAINMHGGDIPAAGRALRVSPGTLTNHVYKNPRLRALFVKDVMGVDLEPDDVQQMVRDVEVPRSDDKSETSILQRNLLTQNLDLLADGLQRAGIKPETVEKLKKLGEIEKGAAGFLVSSLDMMHRSVVYSGIEMMERATEIRTNYLDNSIPMSAKDRQGWQRQYNQLMDMLGKSYDRVLHGTEVMVKLTAPKEKKDLNAKPGFKPLTKQAERPNGQEGK